MTREHLKKRKHVLEASVGPQYVDVMEQVKEIIIEGLWNRIIVERQTRIQLERTQQQ
jgi:hypothetical protein